MHYLSQSKRSTGLYLSLGRGVCLIAALLQIVFLLPVTGSEKGVLLPSYNQRSKEAECRSRLAACL
jgi:hypothetical protein